MSELQRRRRKSVSLQDVAREACVSLGTASMALNSKKGVNASTRKLVVDVATRLGYLDRQYRSAIFNKVGVWLPPPDSGGSYFETMLLRGISLAASELGIEVVYISSVTGRYGVAVPVPDLVNSGIDGLIIYGADLGHLGQLQDFAGNVVLLDTHCDFKGLPSVNNDDEAGAYKAVRHLIELGYMSIGYVGSVTGHGTKTWRGYTRAMSEGGLYINPNMVDMVKWGVGNGYASMNHMIERVTIPRAVFCAGDELAYGVIQAVQDHGLAVPDDVAVAAMDDIDLSVNFRPSLTTVHVSIAEMGKQSITLLAKLMEGDTVPEQNLILPNHLLIRDSCGAKTRLEKLSALREGCAF